ncbi:MAG: DUF927 domain-containing protein [Holosporaceae bacterium]|nr:DUF927 domain-containing protein [Holosporaceae bacterium]
MNNVLYKKLQEIGIPAPPEEVTASKIVRWGHNKRYWAVQFIGGYAIGDWASNLQDYVFEDKYNYQRCKRQIAETQQKLTNKRHDDQTNAAATALQIWRNASNCTTHPYLETKKIKAHGLKIDRQTLLIPLYDENNNLTSLQKIWPDPDVAGKFTKRFLKCGRTQGCSFTIGCVKDEVVICEGYATGATIHELTGLPVVVAFSCNNLLAIAKIIRKKYPDAKIIVAADNDQPAVGSTFWSNAAQAAVVPHMKYTLQAQQPYNSAGHENSKSSSMLVHSNPGLTKAKEAAAAVKARLVVPEFANNDDDSSDFNDLYVLEGPEKVQSAFFAKKNNVDCDLSRKNVQNADEIEKKEETHRDNENEIIDKYMPKNFRLTAKALYYIDKHGYATYLCSYLRVLGKTINIDTNESGNLLEFRTIHGEIKKICMKNKDLFAGNSQTILKDLAGAGLHINLEAPTKKILVYINNYSPKYTLKTMRKSGWCTNGFLTENGVITVQERKQDILLDTTYGLTYVDVNGSITDWRENIGKLCCGNSRLVLAASTAFAAPLLHVLDRPNFGIQLVGKSSAGKTTALYVAASIYGPRNYVKSWRATDNGLETVAFNHNDMLLILDEMGEMSPQKIGATVYMLANGIGKTRSNSSGDAKQPKTWRIALLSAGEVDLNTHMASAGFATMAGQNIRLLAVPAIPEGHRSLVENTHRFATPAALVRHLINATQRYYGAALPEYIKLLMRNQEEIIDDFNNALEAQKTATLPSHADGQDNRVFDFFFTVGFAGELATKYGLTGWPEGEAASTAMAFFNGWIAHKGGFGNQEEKMLLYSLRCFFQKNQYSSFVAINEYNDADESKTVQEFIGYRKNTPSGVVFYANPERLKEAMRKEITVSFQEILRLADAIGILERTDNKHFSKMVRIKNRSIRMLAFNDKVLADEEYGEKINAK